MNALVDRHHHALFYSLQRLFEDRLDVTVYTPIGHEWWDAGYWQFGQGYGDDRLALQFLAKDRPGEWTEENGSYVGKDNHHPERPIYAVTLEQAREMTWDYVVATVQDNQHGFHRFAQETGAKYVLQVGNTNQDVDWSLDPLALVSSEVPIRGRGFLYHQEIDLERFAYSDPRNSYRWATSFVNCFGSTPCSALYEEAKGLLMGSWAFASHGIDGPQGNIETVKSIADIMWASSFGWHDKVQGDGFGHVIHDWAAVGRPLIGHGSHYRGLMGEVFWQDLVTCIDLDKHSISETVALMVEITDDYDRWTGMCRAIRAEFDRIDYDAEAEAIREFLA